MLWLQFMLCSLLIVVVGSLLSRYADVLAEKTGLGRSWVGAVLMAGATSLPELATGISAVRVIGDVNLAAGGVMGSCLFNLLILALLDLGTGPEPLLHRAETGHILSAGLGSVLLMVVAASLFVMQLLPVPNLGWIGLPSIVIVLVYVAAVRMISFFEKRRAAEVLSREAAIYQYETISLWRAASTFALLSLGIVALGLWLALLGDQIVAATGLGASFVGVIFLAVATSLPEIVASYAALRLNAVDLAVSNIFGSNIFNILALAIYDIIDFRGNMWSELQPIHSFTAITATLMTAIAIVSLVYRAARKLRWTIGWDSLLLISLYLGSIFIVYRFTL